MLRNFEELGIKNLKAAKNVEQLESNMNASCIHCVRLHRNGGNCLDESCPILRFYEQRLETFKKHGGHDTTIWTVAWRNTKEWRG